MHFDVSYQISSRQRYAKQQTGRLNTILQNLIHTLSLSLSLSLYLSLYFCVPIYYANNVLTLSLSIIWSSLTLSVAFSNLEPTLYLVVNKCDQIGQRFKACGNNYFDQITHILGNFWKGVKIFHFSSEIIFGQLL